MAYETSGIATVSSILFFICRTVLFFAVWNRFVSFTAKSDGSQKYNFFPKHTVALFLLLVAAESVVLMLPASGMPLGLLVLAGIVLTYTMAYRREVLPETVFALSLYANFRYLNYFVVNSITVPLGTFMMKGIELAEDIDRFVFVRIGILQTTMELLYLLVLVLEIVPLLKIFPERRKISWTECGYLSVLNVAGVIFALIMMRLSIVQMEDGVFVLTDERPELLWQLPFVAALIYFAEMSAIYMWRQNSLYRQQRELYFRERMEKEAIKQRLQDTTEYYERIRKVRHEMANHISNMRGLLELGHMEELEKYMRQWDSSVQSVEMAFATGNPVTDVVVNDRCRTAKEKQILFSSAFAFREEWHIPAYDMGIVVSNLLDNAIRAAEQMPEAERFVSIRLAEQDPVILITCENSYDPDAANDERRKSEWHGLGLKNVREIAERYDGGIRIESDGQVFLVKVLMKKQLPL